MSDIELLKYDLCGRIPFNTYVEVEKYHTGILKGVDSGTVSTDRGINYPIGMVKPYLRSMSTMTDEEKNECCAIFNNSMYQFEVDKYGDVSSTKETVERENIYYDIELMDEWIKWLNKHHFDFRGLIGKGQALEALEGMYNI